jgi:hypothetical protein
MRDESYATLAAPARFFSDSLHARVMALAG